MKTVQLLSLGGFAALYLTLAQIGVAFIYIFGLPPGTGGIINILWSATIPVIAVLVVRRFWAATIMLTIYYALALPLPIGGTPGFFPKILLGIVGGFSIDVIYYLFKRNRALASVLMAAVSQVVLGFSVVVFGSIFSMPGVEKIEAAILKPQVLLFAFVVSGLLGFSAWLTYKKIEKTSVVRRIQSE